MIQEILTYLIICASVAYSAYHIYLFFRNISKKDACACATCPLKNSNMLKDPAKKFKEVKR